MVVKNTAYWLNDEGELTYSETNIIQSMNFGYKKTCSGRMVCKLLNQGYSSQKLLLLWNSTVVIQTLCHVERFIIEFDWFLLYCMNCDRCHIWNRKC